METRPNKLNEWTHSYRFSFHIYLPFDFLWQSLVWSLEPIKSVVCRLKEREMKIFGQPDGR